MPTPPRNSTTAFPARPRALFARLPILATLPIMLLAGACADPPAVREANRRADIPAEAPALVPLDTLLQQAQSGSVSDETGATLAARGAALRAQAAAIRSDAQSTDAP